MTTAIEAQHLKVFYPLYGSSSRSLKKTLVRAATGGLIASDARGVNICAIDDVSFSIAEGERVGLVGHNGAGKTTLLRAMAGIYKPARGTLNVRGRIASLLDISLGMDDEFTGYENIYMRAVLMGIAKSELNKRMDEIIEFSELGDYIKMPMRTYSAGMSMRLAFSVCTAFPADIVLMDEWLSVGDAEFSKKAEARLMEFISKSSILVLASHKPEQIEKICNRVMTMNHGKIIGDSKKNAEKGAV
ncbi:MAG TPA: ABC transporter ATP-binding protein [Smithella sp.]|mgnify:CR=1 FL=1|nr:ABC transporter ATP-binding protein [Smithella sp.]HRS97836.1 ABC transporter ATP-binding protein [Smithella sp.]